MGGCGRARARLLLFALCSWPHHPGDASAAVQMRASPRVCMLRPPHPGHQDAGPLGGEGSEGGSPDRVNSLIKAAPEPASRPLPGTTAVLAVTLGILFPVGDRFLFLTSSPPCNFLFQQPEQSGAGPHCPSWQQQSPVSILCTCELASGRWPLTLAFLPHPAQRSGLGSVGPVLGLQPHDAG